MAVALRILYGIDMGLHLEKSYETSRLLQKFSGIKLQPHKAVVGEGAFAQEAGLVVTGWKKLPYTAETHLPELVGQHDSLVLGKKSGKASIALKLQEMSLSATEKQIAAILSEVKNKAQKAERPLRDKDFQAILGRILESRRI